MGYLWLFHTSRAARGQEWFGASAIASRAVISFPRCPGKAVALSQPSRAVPCCVPCVPPALCQHSHCSLARECWAAPCPDSSTLPIPPQCLPPQPPHLPPLPVAGRILSGSSALSGGPAWLPCEVPWKFIPHPAGNGAHRSSPGPWGLEKHSQRWEMISYSWTATAGPGAHPWHCQGHKGQGWGQWPPLGCACPHPMGRGSGTGRAGPCSSAG